MCMQSVSCELHTSFLALNEIDKYLIASLLFTSVSVYNSLITEYLYSTTMPSIYDLNYTTMWRILRHTETFSLSILRQWKKYIPLLGVCKWWRDMLLHSVYQHAFIEFHRSLSDPELGFEWSSSAPKANIDLIRSCRWCSFVTTLKIILDVSLDFNKSMCIVVNNFILKCNEWPAVTTLYIHFGSYKTNVPFDTLPNYTDEYNQKSWVLANTLTELIRDVRCLDIDSRAGIIIPHSFTSALVNEYNRSLIFLSCPPIIIQKSLIYFSEHLTSLNINFANLNLDYFPTVLTSSLILLSLEGIPSSFSLLHFTSPDRSTNVEFANLEYLKLKYSRLHLDKHRTSYGKQVYHCGVLAPKLVDVFLIHPSPDCEILYALSNMRLETLLITGSARCIQFLSLYPLNVLKHIIIYFTDICNSSANAFYGASNYFCSQYFKDCSTTLIMDGSSLNFSASKINWLYLKVLDIRIPIDITILLEILYHSPRIKMIEVHNLVSNKFEERTLHLTFNKHGNLKEACPKLSHILISRKAMHNSVTHLEMINIITELITAIPFLEYLQILEEFSNDIKNYIKLATTTYPQLNIIEIVEEEIYDS